MPKLNSKQLKNQQMILDWVGRAWGGLKESNKIKVWQTVYNKVMPSQLKVDGMNHTSIINIYSPEQKSIEEFNRKTIDLEATPETREIS